MNPTILEGLGPGFLNQAPTLRTSGAYHGLVTYLSSILGNERTSFGSLLGL